MVKADPKPFLGYSDNTNLLNWLWTAGVAGFYGGSTQVHLGAGPVVDPIHLAALRAALITGERLEITEPGYAEDYGREWTDPAALTEFGDREPTEPWTWAGPPRVVTGPTWGGCIEVIQWILTAGRFDADPAVLAGGVLLVESGEELISAREFGWILRSLGERGMLAAVDAVLVARPPASNLDRPRPALDDRAAHRAAQRDVAVETIARYNPQAVVCVGIPLGTHGRSGSSRTAARSPWTARATRCGPTTAELAPRSPHSTCAARRHLRHGLPGRKGPDQWNRGTSRRDQY